MMKKIFVILCSLLLCIVPCYADILGAGWFDVDCSLGSGCRIEVPASTSDYWGIDEDNDSLVYTGSGTVSGTIRTNSGTSYNWRCTSLSIPEYRQSGSSYSWSSLPCSVNRSSFTIVESERSAESWRSYAPLLYIGLMGVIIVCLMRFKH